MGKHYPLLDQEQVENILKALNFSIKRQRGTSHCQWEGYTEGIRKIVTVDHLIA
jgi:predicted RNA binding protein YcfA (HicA-like mRNA interferase family)